MDPLKRSPAKYTKSTETADTTTYQVVGEFTNKRSVVISGAGVYTTTYQVVGELTNKKSVVISGAGVYTTS